MTRLLTRILVLAAAVFAGYYAWNAFFGPQEPSFTVTKSTRQFDVRNYGDMLCARVIEKAENRTEALNNGFKKLYDYITAKDAEYKQIPMTTPVLVKEQGGDMWEIAFIMPKDMTYESLPRPTSNDVEFVSYPERNIAVSRFSGCPTDEQWAEYAKTLTADLKEHAVRELSHPTYAYYNAPWTPGFMRRNEIWIEVK